MIDKVKKKYTRNNSFYYSIIILSLLIFACIMIVFSMATYNANKNGYVHGLYSQAKLNSDVFTNNLENSIHNILAISNNQNLILLLKSPSVNDSNTKNIFEGELNNSLVNLEYFKGISFLDTNYKFTLENIIVPSCNVQVADNINFSNLDFQNKNYIVKPIENNDSLDFLVISPVLDKKEIIGYIVVLINDEFFDIININNSEEYSSNFVAFFEISTGKPLYFNNTTSYKERMSLYNNNPDIFVKAAENLGYKNNSFEFNLYGTKQEMVASAYANQDNSFLVICAVNKHEMLKTSKYLAITQGFVILLLIVMLYLVLYLIYNRTNKPIVDMVIRCKLIGKGDTSIRFPEQQDRELNILARTFNQTIESVYRFREELEQQAYVDPLLGIGNRMKYIKDLNKHIASYYNMEITMYLIDIAKFSRFNEDFNIEIGDEILKKLCEFLYELFEGNVYRISGDAFSGIRYGECENKYIVLQIKNWFSNNILIKTKQYSLNFNMGVCSYPKYADSCSSLLEHTRSALNYAKQSCETNVVVYDESVLKHMRYEENICNIIKRGMKNNLIDVYYQPIYNIKDKTFRTAEALVRVKDNDGNIINTMEIIRIAEKDNLIDELGEYVLKKTCNMIKQLKETGSMISTIYVNTSVLQIMHIDFAENALKIIHESGISPQNIGFEITEGIMIQSFEYVKTVLKKLREQNITIALDDFGSGYSSINYLSHLPINSIKLDRELVQTIDDGDEQLKLIEAVVQMSKSRDLTVIAEGVETKVQAELIQKAECDCIQGYYYSKPLQSEELINFCKEKSKASL